MLKRIGHWVSPSTAPPIIHTLRMTGMIADSQGSQRLCLSNVERGLARAFDRESNSRLKAVAISINSPGGSPVQSSLIHSRIRALAKQYDIPVYTFAEDVAASGGYMLLAAGDKAFADKSSIVGSIGVVSGSFGFSELIKKYGVDRRVLSAGENKVRNDPFSEWKPEDRDHTRSIMAKLHEQFKDLIRESRAGKLNSEKEAELFSGDYWLATDAKELGLIDDIGHAQQIMRRDFGEEVEFRKVSISGMPWPISQFREASSLGHSFSSDGFAEQLSRALVETAEEKLMWERFQ